MSTSGNRAIDMLIVYRLLKILTTPFEKQDAFKYGIIDKDGKVLRRYTDVKDSREKKSYTWLHRFCFNVKRIMKKVGLGGRLGSLAMALTLLVREEYQYEKYPTKMQKIMGGDDSRWAPHKRTFESGLIQWLKHIGKWEELLEQDRNLPEMANHLENLFREDKRYVHIEEFLGCDVYYNGTTCNMNSPRAEGSLVTNLKFGIDRGNFKEITYADGVNIKGHPTKESTAYRGMFPK